MSGSELPTGDWLHSLPPAATKEWCLSLSLFSSPHGKPRGKALGSAGFTFIEMVIVIVMLGILLTIAVPIYRTQVLISKETVLKHNLAILRERLDQYKADRNKYPASLSELVDTGYLKEIPEDPITGEREWEEVFEDYDPNEPDAEPGISDVKSRSAAVGTNGTPYSEW